MKKHDLKTKQMLIRLEEDPFKCFVMTTNMFADIMKPWLNDEGWRKRDESKLRNNKKAKS